MSVVLNKPKHLISLASSGFIVNVDVHVWSATKQDRGISNEVTTAKNAVNAAGNYVKNLLAGHPKHKAIMNYRQTVTNWKKATAYDWAGSWRYLPATEIERFKKEYAQHEMTFLSLVDDFMIDYDPIVSDMAFKQGAQFSRSDYPSREKVRSKFSMELFINDVPMNDFRCSIASAIAEDLHETYTRQTQTIVENILKDQQKRMAGLLTSLSHCCGYNERTNKAGEVVQSKRKIYDVTVDRAKALCDTFRSFNVAESPELEEARTMLDMTLRGVTAEDIRNSDSLRAQVKDGVDEILSKFNMLNIEDSLDEMEM